VAFIFYISGMLLKIYPPKKRNYWYGYRTLRSLKNNHTWTEANTYAAFISRRVALALAIIGCVILIALPSNEKIQGTTTILLVFTSAALIVVLTEKHLKRMFDKEGKPISNN